MINTQVFQYPLFVNQVDASFPVLNVVPDDNDSAKAMNDCSVNKDLPKATPAGMFNGFGWFNDGNTPDEQPLLNF